MDLLHPGTVWQRNLRSLLIGAIALITGASTAFAVPHYIVGGDVENDYPAAGALIYNNEQSCTGTLVAPRVVLTAAHCLADFHSSQGHSFYIGTNANNLSEGTVIEITELIPHAQYTGDGESYDIGLVRLASDAPVEPIGFNTRTMDDSFINQSPLFVGYGVTSGQSEDAGIKRSVNVSITSFEADSFRYTDSVTGTCFGDSGGPALLEVDGVLKVLGVTSWGDQNCAEFGVNTRTDLYSEFIQCVIDNAEDCGGRVIDENGSEGGGPGDTQNGYPDDWCTDGDGHCDEPCETPDTDCGPDGENNNTDTGQEEGYCIPGDGFCDDWCNPVDTDCENQLGDQTGGSGQEPNPPDEDYSQEDEPQAGQPDGSQASSTETTSSGSQNVAQGVDAGGCAQASPDGLLWLLLLGCWGILRQTRRALRASE